MNARLPAPGRRIPVTTYRLQLQESFGFAAAECALDYLETLGITDLYLSPILQATAGSTHGYDVVDHSEISRELGGREAFESLARAAHARGMGVIVDVVPNHMAVPTPLYQNKAMWQVLRDREKSEYIEWFDGARTGESLVLPVLGERIGRAIAQGAFSVGELVVPGFEDEGPAAVLRYHDHVFPLREGTPSLPLTELLERQYYRLAYWKIAGEELNYRRFFDVDTLAAVRVELREVFDATHALLFELFDAGHIDGFRIDHPDGLADPRGYFRWLSERTDGAWIAAEKILEPTEQLPTDWPIAGTTGYDTAWRAGALQVEPAGALPLAALQQRVTGSNATLAELVEAGKREIATTSLYAEIHRLARLAAEICHADIRLRDHTFRSFQACFLELVVAFERYRAYVVPGEPAPSEAEGLVRQAAGRAAARLDEDLGETLDVVVNLVLGNEVGSAGRIHELKRAELIVRFQQVCGAVTAKGVEDTAFFRWTHLVSLSEVGGSPTTFGLSPDEFHAHCATLAKHWPATISGGSTHDNKRSEDVRNRIGVISQFPEEWGELVKEVLPVLDGVAGETANLVLQTVAGSWTDSGPIALDRLTSFAVKAAREQKTWTSWTAPDIAGESRLTEAVAQLLVGESAAAFTRFAERTESATRCAILSFTALHLCAPGVADIFNGTETTQTFLVDPDNRAPVDIAGLAASLERVDAGKARTLAHEKLELTAAICRARRAHPAAFVGPVASYKPLASSTGHVVAFARGAEPAVCVVALRLWRTFMAAGGCGVHTVVLPEGSWLDARSGARHAGGEVPLAELIADFPAAVLVREWGA